MLSRSFVSLAVGATLAALSATTASAGGWGTGCGCNSWAYPYGYGYGVYGYAPGFISAVGSGFAPRYYVRQTPSYWPTGYRAYASYPYVGGYYGGYGYAGYNYYRGASYYRGAGLGIGPVGVGLGARPYLGRPYGYQRARWGARHVGGGYRRGWGGHGVRVMNVHRGSMHGGFRGGSRHGWSQHRARGSWR
jgi:hypothetical protein